MMMEYSKCQQGDHDDDEEEDRYEHQHDEEFEDEPAERHSRQGQRSRSHDDDDDVEYNTTEENPTRQAAATTTTTTRTNMVPLEMESSSNDMNENDNHYNVDSDEDRNEDEDDAVTLLGSETGGGGAATAGDFYIRHSNSNASTSSYSSGGRRPARRGLNRYHHRYNNIDNDNITNGEITLREMAAVQGKTCCPVYFCAVILLILLVAAIFVAPTPTTPPTTDNGSDSHYRSPASSAAQEQEQLQKLQCELDIIGADTSWDAYVQNVSSPSWDGNRCILDPITQTATPCLCANPTLPAFPHQPTSYAQRWQRTFQQNLDRIVQWESSAQSSNNNNHHLDVVFVGDSITEHWVGTNLNMRQPAKLSGIVRVFHSLFGDISSSTPAAGAAPIKSSTTNLLGMALGIAGDRCPNLLYRLQNGELPSSSDGSLLQPSIFWILIGTNDVGGDKCLASQVIAGTIAIVKYIQQERPNAKIVVNSILPCGYKIDYWREMYQPINQAMECFVQGFQKQQRKNDDDADDGDNDNRGNNGKLYFFNATDLFLTADQRRMNYTLLPDRLHPGEEGSWVWGRAMVEKIQEILAT